MGDEKKNEGSCSTSGCGCCGGAKKFFAGILVGLILTAAAFGICQATKCATGGAKMCPTTKMCPITKMPMEAPPAQ